VPKLSFEFLRQGVTPPKKQNRAVLGTPLYERYSQPGIGFWTIGSLYPRDNIPREFFGEFFSGSCHSAKVWLQYSHRSLLRKRHRIVRHSFHDVQRHSTDQFVLVVQRFGVGLLIERSLVRLPAGAIKSARSTQPSIPPG